MLTLSVHCARRSADGNAIKYQNWSMIKTKFGVTVSTVDKRSRGLMIRPQKAHTKTEITWDESNWIDFQRNRQTQFSFTLSNSQYFPHF